MEIIEQLQYQAEPLPISESSDSLVLTTDPDVPDDLDGPDTNGLNAEGFDVVDGIATTDVAALYRAVGNLDVNAVETIVKSGVDVNCHDAKYRCNYAMFWILILSFSFEI